MSGINSGGKIALLLPKLSTYGGAEGFAFRLATALAQEGHEVDFLCARQETPAPTGVHPVVLGRPPLGRAAKIAWFAYAAERTRKRGGYALSVSMGKTLGQDILRMSGGPQKIFWRLSLRGYAEGFERNLKNFRRKTGPSGKIIQYLEHKALTNQRICVTVSHRVKDWLLEAHPWLAQRDLRVIYNRPDLTKFTPVEDAERMRLRQRFGVTPDKQMVVLAGTNFALKGLGPTIKALSLLPKETQLFVAGGRNPRRFMGVAQQWGVKNRVTFLGRVQDMVSLYRASDLFCLPSFYDTCSNAVLEALASGTRVISSLDNGSSRFLAPEHVIANPEDHETLAKMIEATLSRPRPQGFTWPKDVAAGLAPWLDLVRSAVG